MSFGTVGQPRNMGLEVALSEGSFHLRAQKLLLVIMFTRSNVHLQSNKMKEHT